MHTLSRSLALAAFAGLFAGCGAQPEPAEQPAGHVVALRFAGVDLIYALRRVAGEADLLLVLDEVRPRDLTGEDLALQRVDLDLTAGPVDAVLAQLQTVSDFDYRIDDGVLIVRSARSLDSGSVLDRPALPGTKLDADFPGLLRWLGQTSPDSYLHMGARRGQPVFRRVSLDVEEGTSVLDLLVDFARATGAGLRIRRAGYAVEGQDDRVVATTVGMWSSFDAPRTLPQARETRAIVVALASVESRTGVPICVLDRSVLLDGRGSLSFSNKVDRGLPLERALAAIAWRGEGTDADFEWELRDGLAQVRSHSFSYYLTGRDLLDEPLEAGVFEGTLAELARWLNRHRKTPSAKVLVGGEVVGSAPRARLEIADGTRVLDVLYQFAAATGEGWNYVVRDSASPVHELDSTWAGASISRLADWSIPE